MSFDAETPRPLRAAAGFFGGPVLRAPILGLVSDSFTFRRSSLVSSLISAHLDESWSSEVEFKQMNPDVNGLTTSTTPAKAALVLERCMLEQTSCNPNRRRIFH